MTVRKEVEEKSMYFPILQTAMAVLKNPVYFKKIFYEAEERIGEDLFSLLRVSPVTLEYGELK